MSTTVQNITAAELLRLPADGRRYELVRGELRQMAPAERALEAVTECVGVATASLLPHWHTPQSTKQGMDKPSI